MSIDFAEQFPNIKGSFSVCAKSTLIIGENCQGNGVRIDIVDSTVVIGANTVLGNIDLYARGSEIHIGSGSGFSGYAQVLSHEPSRILIGDNFLCAGQVMITTSDMHSILNATTGKRINPSSPVSIGHHVWVGQGVYILKGVEIGEHSVIGAASIVTKNIPAHSLAIGSPARPIRSNITWDYHLINDFESV